MVYLKSEYLINEKEIKHDFVKDSNESNLKKSHIAKAFVPEKSPEISFNKNSNSLFVNSEAKEKLAKVFWKRLKRGDMDALGELYELYVDELFSYGMEKINNKIRIMDAIHDLFVDLYKYRSSITTPTNVKYYLLRSLKRKVYRKQSSKKSINLKDSILETQKDNSELSCEEKMVEAEYSKERKDKLRSALTFLSKRQQKGLHLRFTENQSYEEIAEIMNISIPTSRTVVYRALLVLKKHCLPIVLIIFKYIF